MSLRLPWQCPHCFHHATITDQNFSSDIHFFEHDCEAGKVAIYSEVIVCPNTECRKFQLAVQLRPWSYVSGKREMSSLKVLKRWTLEPQAKIIPFPEYVPEAIKRDYQEACLIKELSPKASATLSRRCLQGMIRDFHGIRKNTLYLEIDALRENIDEETWLAIDAVRKIGNIGAHMEKEIDTIVEVEPEEASLLIQMIETLVKDWYIARHERQRRTRALVEVASAKEAERKA